MSENSCILIFIFLHALRQHVLDNPVCRDINMVGKHSYSREFGNCRVVHQKLQKTMNKSKLFMMDSNA